ncbi:putative metal-binding membrane protein [Microbacterium proteolyticum]|uniref:Putative metal-binding membrane protein n=1 Tax=Microbacterium proteolyticum TaxID=1572644 RepID=A0A7W5CIE5_9MICO|nr:hypothetical protein [Microbacterium proteolyticum]MBB3158282.1 putative metal-binding membrane protein [Microbacterium proteolyticum]
MTVAVSRLSGRRSAERAVRLALAVFLLLCAWATTHLDEAGGHHEGTAHSALTVGSFLQTDDDEMPDAALVPPVDTDATNAVAADGSENVTLVLAAVVFSVLGVLLLPTVRGEGMRSGAPPPRRHPLIVFGISRT